MRAHVRGAAEMLRPGDIILIGEVHGSSEIPAVVGALMSEALACGLHVELGLEMELPPAERSRMDTFLASDGGAAARAALLRGEHWRFEDGRASEAVLELVEQARAARVPLFAIDEAVADVRGGPLHAAAIVELSAARRVGPIEPKTQRQSRQRPAVPRAMTRCQRAALRRWAVVQKSESET